MAVLKKLKASTLMETLVATVLIVVVFMMASMTLNSLFANTMALNDDEVRQELLYLQYQYEHRRLSLPYYGEIGQWSIEVEQVGIVSDVATFSAVHGTSGKKVSYNIGNE
ncbi:MAG: hypothetical protein ACX93O_14790 [Flagellimonas sp.]